MQLAKATKLLGSLSFFGWISNFI